jgi:hypothetical protein
MGRQRNFDLVLPGRLLSPEEASRHLILHLRFVEEQRLRAFSSPIEHNRCWQTARETMAEEIVELLLMLT